MPLKAYYNFEQSSGDLEDITGNGNDSSSVSVTSRTATGILGGNSYGFDGTDDFVSIGSGTALDFGNSSLSVAAWVLHSDTTQAIITQKGGAGFSAGYRFRLDDIADFKLADGSNALSAESTAAEMPENEWAHLVGTFSDTDSESKIYINGVEVGSASGTMNSISNADTFTIGASSSSGNNSLNGNIDELRIYDHALTPQEVAYLYEVTQNWQYTSSVKTLS